MSHETKEGICRYYDNLSMSQLIDEVKLYSRNEATSIKNYTSKALFEWDMLDQNDKNNWKKFLWKCLAVGFFTNGIYKISKHQEMKRLIGWNPAWDKSFFIKFVKFRHGIPFIFLSTSLLIPSFLFNSIRIGLKHHHLNIFEKDQEKLQKLMKSGNLNMKREAYIDGEVNPLLPRKNI